MAVTYTDTLFATEYKDDFRDSAGFYRILYNPGRVLQARELTQMQTIINKQVQRFGNNIFKEGAAVKPGGFTVDNKYEFVKLDSTSSSFAASVGDIITGGTSGVKAEVLEVAPATINDPVTFYVRYVNTTSVANATTSPRFVAGESLGSGRVVQIANTTANPAIGRGTRVTVGESIYFTQGFFVYTEKQNLIISRYTDDPTKEVGFKIIQDTVSVNDDTSLYDNQGGGPNITAPGADRYRIRLVLTTLDLVDSDENFISVASVKEGVIYQAVAAGLTQQYNIPRDVVAKRIKENSGDYEVKPFRIQFEPDSANTHLLLKISGGIVVVDGYRSARMVPTDIRIPKPTATAEIEGEFTAIDYGNYVDVLSDSAIGGPNISTFQSLDIQNARNFAGGASGKIGEARVRAVHENGADLRYHLFDIRMNAGKNFRDALSIGADSNNYFNPIQTGTNTTLEDTRNNSLLFPLPHARARVLDPKSVEVQIMRKGTSDGSGNFTITVPSNYTLDNAGDWIFITDASNGGRLANSGLGGLTTGSSTATITGLPTSAPITAYVYASTGSPAIRSKILTQNATVTGTIQTDAYTGDQYIDLGTADIFQVTRMRTNDSDGNDLLSKFRLDNGQRDNMYDFGRMVLNRGQTAPTGNVYVKFDHFTHTSGNYFAVNSYTGQVNYDQIPEHRISDGTILNLRDVLDFRPVKTTATTFTEANISYLPQPSDLVMNDNTYYLSRAYKLAIDKDGNIKINPGDDAFTPVPPAKTDGTMPLYNFALGGNTLDENDIVVSKINHRRYTMQDIEFLDKRISKLEEIASLSMLELQTSNFEVLDSAGLNRTKSGFFVDNFTTHILSDVIQRDYRASIDASRGLLRPVYTDDNIRLVFDSAQSTGIKKTGDNVYLDYTEVKVIDQPFATQSTVINPYTTSVYTGNLVLSPASDEWRDKLVKSKNVIDNGSTLSTNRALHWDEWSWGWGGKSIEDLQVGDATNTISKTSHGVTTNTVNKVVSESTVLEVIDERVLQVSLLPFMRARIIKIKARGLRPNANVFLFMDNKPMADYVREENFVPYSSDTTDYGNTLKNKLFHPDGAGALTTNAAGAVDISFMVPNNVNHSFRAGEREVKILDTAIPNENLSGTIARAVYTAQGFLDTVHQDITSTRVLEVEGARSRTGTPTNYYSGGSDDGGGGGGTGGGGTNWYNPEDWKSAGMDQPRTQAGANDFLDRMSRQPVDTVHDAGGPEPGGGCCFIMLEARYGDGTMDNVVRRYRDEYMTDRNRRGYYKLAEVLVPLMRKSKVFKWIVTKTFADPLVSYGKYYYGENKHGVIFAPVKSFWMKVFDVIGGDTEFIRENGEVV